MYFGYTFGPPVIKNTPEPNCLDTYLPKSCLLQLQIVQNNWLFEIKISGHKWTQQSCAVFLLYINRFQSFTNLGSQNLFIKLYKVY